MVGYISGVFGEFMFEILLVRFCILVGLVMFVFWLCFILLGGGVEVIFVMLFILFEGFILGGELLGLL